jgi:hypothetical protein
MPLEIKILHNVEQFPVELCIRRNEGNSVLGKLFAMNDAPLLRCCAFSRMTLSFTNREKKQIDTPEVAVKCESGFADTTQDYSRVII